MTGLDSGGSQPSAGHCIENHPRVQCKVRNATAISLMFRRLVASPCCKRLLPPDVRLDGRGRGLGAANRKPLAAVYRRAGTAERPTAHRPSRETPATAFSSAAGIATRRTDAGPVGLLSSKRTSAADTRWTRASGCTEMRSAAPPIQAAGRQTVSRAPLTRSSRLYRTACHAADVRACWMVPGVVATWALAP